MKSLRFRLCAWFTVLLLMAWLAAAFMAWRECRDYINEFFDTQQLIFAKTLAVSDLSNWQGKLPDTKEMLKGVKKPQQGKQKDDALSFAVFDDGRMILANGKKAEGFIFNDQAGGFVEGAIRGSDDEWRILWMPSQDGRFLIAVGQEIEYRQDMAWDMLQKQIMPWAVLGLALVLLFFVLTTKELRPLKKIAANLQTRRPNDTSRLALDKAPSEVLPLLNGLNSLFVKVGHMLARERAFVSDAAHELRTPLAALQVQAEVALMSDQDEDARRKALDNLLAGIGRSSRLLNQLLNLSRLENMALEDKPSDTQTINWPEIISQVLEEHESELRQKQIKLDLLNRHTPFKRAGDSFLIGILLRNLLDNAIGYTPEQGHIVITLDKYVVSIANSGGGIGETHLPRLGERFYRPPGQSQRGSGLGLSIVKRIAELHGLGLSLSNQLREGEKYFTASIIIYVSGQNTAQVVSGPETLISPLAKGWFGKNCSTDVNGGFN